MRHLKRLLPLLLAIAAPLFVASQAKATGETVSATTELTPRSSTFYKGGDVASNLRLRAQVSVPEGAERMLPMKNVRVTFPEGMGFKPNGNVCTDAQLNLNSPLSSPSAIVNRCPKAVIGTGTATILLGKLTRPMNVVDDPVLVVFNAGVDAQKRPKIKIFGYSLRTKVGILMEGVLDGRVLDIAIPVLSNDSAVEHFILELPGKTLNRPDIGINVRGLDPNYVQARCVTGLMTTDASFKLGERDPNTGTETGPTTDATAPQTSQDCTGKAGRPMPKLKATVKGPNAVKRGKKGVFTIAVRNSGDGAGNVVVTSNRGGKANAGSVQPGKVKTVKVKVAIRGKKGKKVAVKFTAKSGNIKTSVVKRVKVK